MELEAGTRVIFDDSTGVVFVCLGFADGNYYFQDENGEWHDVGRIFVSKNEGDRSVASSVGKMRPVRPVGLKFELVITSMRVSERTSESVLRRFE